jgi:TolB-like protein/DNA-binding winged helix-turn-helix (wHTH) protein/Tfp pilus assembly protein PilF
MGSTGRETFGFEGYTLDLTRGCLRKGDREIGLRPKSFALLRYFVENPGRLVSKDELTNALWPNVIVGDESLSRCISDVRHAVDDEHRHGRRIIKTVHGRGYLFDSPVSVQPPRSRPVDAFALATETVPLGDTGAAHTFIRTLPHEGFVAEVREDGTPAGPMILSATLEAPPSFTKPSILVLPFRNISGDPGQDYLTDAVTNDLTVDLSRVCDIAVISAATALTYKGSSLDVRQIGRDLGVRYLVVASIGRSGDLVRTNVQLIDAASGEQLWGDRFENQFVHLERLEDAITGRIAASLNIQLVRAEGRRATQVPQPDALDLRLRATALFFSSIAPEHTLATRQLLERSAELDPNSAETWARLGQNLATDYVNSWNNSGKEELRVAEEAVRKALLIDPGHALAHMVHGLVQRARGEHHAALEAFSRAVELDRNFAVACANKGNQLILVGRPTEAQTLVEQAIRLSPHDPSIGMFYWIIGRSLFFAGQYREAIPWFRKSVESRPNLWFNRLYLVSACTLADMREEARRALSEFNRCFPNPLYTLAVVEEREAATPNDDPTVVTVRDQFHEGLRRAGMAEH